MSQHNNAPGQEANHPKHNGSKGHSNHEEMFRVRFWISLILSIPVLVFSPSIQSFLSYSLPQFPGSRWITPVFSTVVFIYGGLPFLEMAGPELRKRQPGMMTLISMGILVAFIYSMATLFLPAQKFFFWELVTLIDIMLLGHWIEMRSVRQASSALDELAQMLPDEAERVKPDGEIETVPISELSQGDLVLVRPGSSVPADGRVVKGESQLDESMITGESKPVQKEPGSDVVAGTINGDGSLRVEVQATGDETALAGIMRLVEEAQESKSDTQKLADRAAGWLFYIALAVAVLTALIWSLAQGFSADVVTRVATVLVIACPHALGLAIPLVVAITTALGARNGILIRDRLALETMRQVDTVVFDKTGTLTKGEFGVVDWVTQEGLAKEEALALSAAVEADSEHTMARGIRSAAKERNLDLPPVKAFEALKGRGVKAEQDGRSLYVGGPRLLEKLELETPEAFSDFIQKASQQGQSVVYLISEENSSQQVLAAFALADLLRPESKPAVQKLQENGIKVVILTGDSQAVTRTIADELGVRDYFAEVLPDQKDQKIKELQTEQKIVAMVGDGVNDAPALTRADVGIAIGSGTDVAIESAGIILVKSNPLAVVKVFELSQASHRKMVQNLFWATGYNVFALPLAAGVLAPLGILLSPAAGALLMSLSTVIVAVNAQLLRRQDISVQSYQREA